MKKLALSMITSSLLFSHSIDSGYDDYFVITDNNQTYVKGSNYDGQLGTGDTYSKSSFTELKDYNFTKISGGGYHSLALDKNGNVYAWGRNYYGELGDGTTTDKDTPTKLNLTNIVQVSAGSYYSLALDKNGNVYAWGYNDDGELGDGTTDNKHNPTEINLSNIVQVSAGWRHSLALDKNGKVYTWGDNSNGELGDGTTTDKDTPTKLNLTNIVQISAGDNHSLALDKNGNVYAWGYNGYGQLGDGTTSDKYTPEELNLSNIDGKVVKIVAAGEHSLLLTNKGKVYAWGYNGYGQLGDGTTSSKHIPTLVKLNKKAVDIAGDYQTSMAVTEYGFVYTWGSHSNGNSYSNLPVKQYLVKKLKKIDSFSNGVYKVVKDNNELYVLHSYGAIKIYNISNEYTPSFEKSIKIDINASNGYNFHPYTMIKKGNNLYIVGYNYDGNTYLVTYNLQTNIQTNLKLNDNECSKAGIAYNNGIIYVTDANSKKLYVIKDNKIITTKDLSDYSLHNRLFYKNNRLFVANDNSSYPYLVIDVSNLNDITVSKKSTGSNNEYGRYILQDSNGNGNFYLIYGSDNYLAKIDDTGNIVNKWNGFDGGIKYINNNLALSADGTLYKLNDDNTTTKLASSSISLSTSMNEVAVNNNDFYYVSNKNLNLGSFKAYILDINATGGTTSHIDNSDVNETNTTTSDIVSENTLSDINYTISNNPLQQKTLFPGHYPGMWSNGFAFAALKNDGSVISFGGGYTMNTDLLYKLKEGVKSVYSTWNAFAALKDDGSVVVWGNSNAGGDDSSVADKLKSGVKTVYSSRYAFAALKDDGSVVVWGNSNDGGDDSSVADELKSGVKTIYSNWGAFAALKDDGSVVVWGGSIYGGNDSSVADKLKSGVKAVYSSRDAFAVLKDDGSVVSWGNLGGNDSGVTDKLKSGVKAIYATEWAFAALKDDGSVVVWGSNFDGGDDSSVADELKSGVKTIYSNDEAFAALKDDGSVVSWGSNAEGGDESSVADKLKSGVKAVYYTDRAFAALKDDGSVVTWGGSSYGGDDSSVADKLKSGVKAVCSNYNTFAALKDDGSVVLWGGGTDTNLSDKLKSGVKAVYATRNTFAVLKDDGSVISWGTNSYGEYHITLNGVKAIISPHWILNQNTTSGINLPPVDDVNTTVTTNIKVGAGWNMINIPSNISNMASINSNSIWKYKNKKWEAYSNNSDILNKIENYNIPIIHSLNAGDGVWVYENSPITLNFTNPLKVSTNLSNLSSGWNLVGISENKDLTSIPSNIETVWYWDNANNKWEVYSSDEELSVTLETYYDKGIFENLDKLEANKAYWFNVK